MFVISRKLGDKITIGDDVEIVVISVKGKQVRLGINAPKTYEVKRVDAKKEV